MSTRVEGKEVNIGDWVGFKSDIEQSGMIIAIAPSRYRGDVLTLSNPSGFRGEYIGGQTTTEVDARDCWVE